MLSAKYRFHSRGGVNYVYRHGRSVRSPLVSLVHMPNVRKKTRIAIVISKKVLKSAVGRNRVRRRVYEVVRLTLPILKTATDAIFVVHSRELADLPFSDLTVTIKDLLNKADLI